MIFFKFWGGVVPPNPTRSFVGADLIHINSLVKERIMKELLTFLRNEMKSSDKELLFIFLDLSDLNLFIFSAHIYSIYLSATALTPAIKHIWQIINQAVMKIWQLWLSYSQVMQPWNSIFFGQILFPFCISWFSNLLKWTNMQKVFSDHFHFLRIFQVFDINSWKTKTLLVEYFWQNS